MSNIYDDVMIQRDGEVLLDFQEPDQVTNVTGGRQSQSFSPSIQANGEFQDDDNQRPPNSSIFSFTYFQEYFNVNTDEVLKRLKCSLLPNVKVNYYEEYIKTKPDLYGPIWICITLAFTIAIGSNLLDYFTTDDRNLPKWKYEFHVITKASLIVFVYAWIIPILMWSLIKWYLASQIYVSAMELICVYGYCLVSYIPLSLLWIIHLQYLQWILMVLVVASSGIILISTMQPMLESRNYSIVGGVIILHILFSVVIFLSFFHVKHPSTISF